MVPWVRRKSERLQFWEIVDRRKDLRDLDMWGNGRGNEIRRDVRVDVDASR